LSGGCLVERDMLRESRSPDMSRPSVGNRYTLSDNVGQNWRNLCPAKVLSKKAHIFRLFYCDEIYKGDENFVRHYFVR